MRRNNGTSSAVRNDVAVTVDMKIGSSSGRLKTL